MSVTATLQLPAQPTSGTVQLVPLGGDGLTAPQAAFVVTGFAATGDASGGVIALNIIMDQNYCSLVSYASVTNVQVAAADAWVGFRVRTPGAFPDRIATQFFRELVPEAAELGTTTIARTWNPTPVIMGGDGSSSQVDVSMENILNDVLTMHALIFLFNNTVRTRAPMGPLLWARGAT